jgi:hypothetical protein
MENDMMKLNAAQTITIGYYGKGDFYRYDYKAPHANRPTPKRSPRRISSVLAKRLFKGHRP